MGHNEHYQEELHCSMCGAHKRHHSTVRSILLLHTHSYLYLNASLFVPYYCCITPRPCACCLIIFETPCAISIFVTNLNTYTVPILFFLYQKTTDGYLNLYVTRKCC